MFGHNAILARCYYEVGLGGEEGGRPCGLNQTALPRNMSGELSSDGDVGTHTHIHTHTHTHAHTHTHTRKQMSSHTFTHTHTHIYIYICIYIYILILRPRVSQIFMLLFIS